MLKVSKKIRDKIIESNPYSKKTEIIKITSPRDGYEIYVSRRGDDNAYFIWNGKYIYSIFSSKDWDIGNFRSNMSYKPLFPDVVLRACDRHNGGGFKSKRDIIDIICMIQSQIDEDKIDGAKDDLNILLQDLTEEEEYDNRVQVSSEIAEYRIGRKVTH
jgi:hypothetical protein